MRVVRLLLVVALLVSAMGACNTGTQPSSAAFSVTDLVVGTGATAETGKTLVVNYTAWLWDPAKTDGKGLLLETTSGGSTFNFVLGNGSVIAGWEQGLPGMKVGGKRRLVIPPSLAYGAARNGAIPPNATLVFEIDLVSVQ
jgi:FKBP-type peptidyl-prolyl cis-trans isomerase